MPIRALAQRNAIGLKRTASAAPCCEFVFNLFEKTLKTKTYLIAPDNLSAEIKPVTTHIRETIVEQDVYLLATVALAPDPPAKLNVVAAIVGGENPRMDALLGARPPLFPCAPKTVRHTDISNLKQYPHRLSGCLPRGAKFHGRFAGARSDDLRSAHEPGKRGEEFESVEIEA